MLQFLPNDYRVRECSVSFSKCPKWANAHRAQISTEEQIFLCLIETAIDLLIFKLILNLKSIRFTKFLLASLIFADRLTFSLKKRTKIKLKEYWGKNYLLLAEIEGNVNSWDKL